MGCGNQTHLLPGRRELPNKDYSRTVENLEDKRSGDPRFLVIPAKALLPPLSLLVLKMVHDRYNIHRVVISHSLSHWKGLFRNSVQCWVGGEALS